MMFRLSHLSTSGPPKRRMAERGTKKMIQFRATPNPEPVRSSVTTDRAASPKKSPRTETVWPLRRMTKFLLEKKPTDLLGTADFPRSDR